MRLPLYDRISDKKRSEKIGGAYKTTLLFGLRLNEMHTYDVQRLIRTFFAPVAVHLKYYVLHCYCPPPYLRVRGVPPLLKNPF